MKYNQGHYSGCLIGGAIGDAFGSAVEFISIDAIRVSLDAIKKMPKA